MTLTFEDFPPGRFGTFGPRHVTRDEIREPLRARLANNVFSDLQRGGIHFETTPPANSSALVVTNNVFANTPRLATLDKVRVQPSTAFGKWIWSEEGRKSPVVTPGVRYFRKAFDLTAVPDKARLDISCDETFTVWVNGAAWARTAASDAETCAAMPEKRATSAAVKGRALRPLATLSVPITCPRISAIAASVRTRRLRARIWLFCASMVST